MRCEDFPCCGHEANDCDGSLYGSDEAIKAYASEHFACEHEGGYCAVAEGEFDDEDEADLDCLDANDANDCVGEVEWRESLSGTGTPIARCDKHHDQALERQARINERYGSLTPPDWFDPSYAGEHWDEDY